MQDKAELKEKLVRLLAQEKAAVESTETVLAMLERPGAVVAQTTDQYAVTEDGNHLAIINKAFLDK